MKMSNYLKLFLFTFSLIIFASCNDYYKDDYYDNSPTSGKLKIYHNEGLTLHIKNQIYTFETQYPKAHCEAYSVNENEAIQALLNDSCKAIFISRLLGDKEIKAFEQKQLLPRYSAIAKTGIALIINTENTNKVLTVSQIQELLKGELIVTDSLNNKIKLRAIIDNKNSAVSRYLLDSLIQQDKFGPNVFALNNSLELIENIAANPNSIGFIDFAWLSDKDDLLYKKFQSKIKFLSVGRTDTAYFEPNQSSFKTNEYPFTRTLYYLKRGDDFTLAKGFEAFMAGPKGQLTFLKQGLLPLKQPERAIEINMQPLNQQP